MKNFAHMTLEELLSRDGHACACGRTHKTGLEALFLGANALGKLGEALRMAGCTRPFVVCDAHTDEAAGRKVRGLLEALGIAYTSFVFPERPGCLEPDETAVGALSMAFEPACDCVLAVGSGVINDCCKTLAHAVRVPSLAVATAPSMDGYASDSASMIQNKLKVSLYNACPRVVIGDTETLAAAPLIMLRAGLGDMLAKYVSICEWRISHLVTGEYYCENIAGLVRSSLAKILEHASGLIRRDRGAVERVMEGLTLSGVAMSFAEISRPASGLEHYFSHLWEMKALRGECPASLHGVQVGVGTCLTLRLYDHIRTLQPDRDKALRYMANFSQEKWEKQMHGIFDPETAENVIRMAKEQGKNDPVKHGQRLEKLLLHWADIQRIIAEELPPAGEILRLMKDLDMATAPEELGLSHEDTVNAFWGSREIREKYLTSSMLWDLGEIEAFTRFL